MEIIYFGVDTVEEYLKSFGLITKNKKNHLKILDAYPPLPDYIINKIIVEVNENSPLIIENWKVGKNKVKFINDDEYYIYLEEFSYPYYNYLKGKSVYTIQCLNFHQEIFIPNHYTSILLDLRCNFGGSITEMQNYYNKLIDIIKLQKIVEISLLVSNTTCSSAELFVEQMADSYKTLIIGSKTYGKKYIYNRQFINNVEILIPKHKLSLSFDINKHFDFNQYYKIKSKYKIKKEYNFPVIKSYNELKGG